MVVSSRVLLFFAIAFAMEPLRAAEREVLEAARLALSDGLYEVAALKAGRLLGIAKLGKRERQEAATLQVEALVRAGRGAGALAVMKQQEVADKAFWEGQALLLVGDYDAAARVLSQYPSDGPLVSFAELALAHAHAGDGRESEARKVLKPLRASSDERTARHARLFYNELELNLDRAPSVLDRLQRESGGKDAVVQFLRARTHMNLGDGKTAEAILRDLLLTGAGAMTELVHDAATLMLAEALWERHSPEAVTELLAFIGSFGEAGNPASTEFWSEAFALLNRMAETRTEDDQLLSAALVWIADESVFERQGFALWFAAGEMHRRGRDVEAIGLLEGLVQQHPRHAKTSEAMRLAMQLHGAQRNDARVLQLAERWRQDFGGGGGAVVDFLVGLIRLARGEHLEALRSFSKAADAENNLSRRRRALYNAAICALKAGEQAAVSSLMLQLSQASSGDQARRNPESAADLELDRALELASKIDPKAEEELSQFIASQGKHPRWVEANVALAEFCLLDIPPRVKRASEALDAAAKSAPPVLMERIGYVRMWLREAEQDLTGVAREGLAFIAAWPSSIKVAEVQMKVADAFYRLDLFAKARTEFELLVRNHPSSPYVDSALFWAGMSAMAQQTDDGMSAAISRWEELAQRGGPLAFTARRQQVVAMQRRGDEASALKLLTTLLDDATGDERLSVQCERAGLLTTMGRKEPGRFEEAVVLLRTELADKALSFAWRARCGVLLATALREQKKITEALEACHDVVDVGSNVVTAPQNPTEFLWYYRAGFFVIEMLEETQQWEAAARMAERLAQSGGDRAQEAAKRASDIRLKHYLWDR